MEEGIMDHPRSGLQFLAAKELSRSRAPFDDFTVNDPAGEKLGSLAGFIVDLNRRRPYYVVADASGWFRSKHVLIPVGHVALDYDARVLVADVAKERVERFAGFDLDLFPQLTKEDLGSMANEIGAVCCPDHIAEPADTLTSQFEAWAHYETPMWWNTHIGDAARRGARPESLSGSRR
jgi:hypothetical protein